MRKAITIKQEYDKVLDKIIQHRPHLKTHTGVIERALDYYLDSIIRLDLEKKRHLNAKGDLKCVGPGK